jgi:hypothetical protein
LWLDKENRNEINGLAFKLDKLLARSATGGADPLRT